MTQETKTKKQERVEKQEALNDTIAVMQTPAGRRYIWRLLEHARVFGSSYAHQSNQTFFREGQRNMGLWIFDELLKASPELFLTMQKEHYILEAPDEPAEEKSND